MRNLYFFLLKRYDYFIYRIFQGDYIMNIEELKNYSVNPAISYCLGLIYPLYKPQKFNGKNYVIGSINHNPGKVTQTELAEHYRSVIELFDNFLVPNTILIKTNKSDEYKISPKEGFSILIESGNLSENEVLEILTNKIKEIKESDETTRKEFVRGCFDGRSSWDNTAHFLSIDVDRAYDRQDLVIEIIKGFGIELNINRRDCNHKKNDQLRIKFDSLSLFMDKIGLYSSCRKNIIQNALLKLS